MRIGYFGLPSCDLSTCATGLADIDAGVPSPEMGERAVDEEGNYL